MTDLNPKAHFHQDEMTDLDPETQDEMTDLDPIEMNDLYPRTLPILNTSRGTRTAPWSKYASEARKLSRLHDAVRLLVEHLQKLHCQHRIQR